MRLSLTEMDVLALCGRTYLERGRSYQRQGRVLDLHWEKGEEVLYGKVKGSGRNLYEQSIQFYPRRLRRPFLRPAGGRPSPDLPAQAPDLPGEHENLPAHLQEPTAEARQLEPVGGKTRVIARVPRQRTIWLSTTEKRPETASPQSVAGMPQVCTP